MGIQLACWSLCRTLDQDNPEQCIIRETEEETGYRITNVTYMSPGAVTEILYFL
jgi:8-oxo-dGTP pyrophosphatase MutT (NUDIX family)